jgi:uncharacterized protein (TIGR03435 family)
MRGLNRMLANRELVSPRVTRFAVVAAVVASFGLVSAWPNYSQTQSQSAAPAPPTYQYDVISIKPNIGSGQGGVTSSPDGFSRRAATITGLIFSGYGLRYPEQLIGAPAWLESEKFDVDAKMDSSVMDTLQKMTQEDRTAARQQMMQSLLADRLKLVAHRETRELPVYTLTIAKSGLEMKEAKAGDTYANGFKLPGGRGGGAGSALYQMGPSGVMITSQGTTVPQLITTLAREVGRMIVDKTGLTGNYDFVLQYTLEGFRPRTDLSEPPVGSGMVLPPDFGAISIFTALPEQLGLKLESVKALVEVVVIDHVERPSGN